MSADKAELRAHAARMRAAAHAADPLAGRLLVRHLPADLRPAPGAVVAGYTPFRTEIDPRPLMHALAEGGRLLALPVTPPRSSDVGLTFRLWREGDALVRSAVGVDEPADSSPLVEPDLVLTPLLAFDRTGARLGYGAGHYDRTLPRLLARPGFRAIGLAYAAQEVGRLPAEPHDVALHGIVTERAYIPVR